MKIISELDVSFEITNEISEYDCTSTIFAIEKHNYLQTYNR